MINYNLTGYLIYLPATFYITFYVGNKLYRNGEPFLADTFHGNHTLSNAYNRFLLTGYYLLNLGYATISINWWAAIQNTVQLIEEVSWRLGLIVMMLGIIHYFNMYSFARFGGQLKRLYENINHTHFNN